jgi:site-specific DNA-cytosine methylase
MDNTPVLTLGSLFSGIGGIELGFESTGMFKTIWQAEIDPYSCQVLKQHWPRVPNLGDVKEIDWSKVERPDVICGGFPCQPVSVAGKKKGDKDERWLWPEVVRCIRAVRPRWAVFENVPGLLSADHGRLFAGVLRDLAESGYDAEWNIISAASVGAWHRRERVFIVAYPNSGRLEGRRLEGAIPCFYSGDEDHRPTLEEFRKKNRAGIWRQDPADLPHTTGKRMWGWDVWGNWEQGDVAESQPPGTDNGGEKTVDASGERGTTFACMGGVANGLSSELDQAWQTWQPRVETDVPDRRKRLKGLGNAVVPQVARVVGLCICRIR